MGFRRSVTLPGKGFSRSTLFRRRGNFTPMSCPDPIDHIGRKHPASGVRIDLGQPTIVFLTVNTRDRRPWLPQPLVNHVLRETWQEAQAWLVGFYILMPDHLHLFCAPRDLNFTLDTWVTYWKSQFKKKLNTHLAMHGRVRLPPNPNNSGRVRLLPNPIQIPQQPDAERVRIPQERHPPGEEDGVRREPHPPLKGNPATFRWQEGKPWDTRLRRSESYAEKWQYVRENPLRKGLVKCPEDWPYQGMLNVLQW